MCQKTTVGQFVSAPWYLGFSWNNPKTCSCSLMGCWCWRMAMNLAGLVGSNTHMLPPLWPEFHNVVHKMVAGVQRRVPWKKERGKYREKEREKKTKRDRDRKGKGGEREGERKPRQNLYVCHDPVLEVTHVFLQGVLFSSSHSPNLIQFNRREHRYHLSLEECQCHTTSRACGKKYMIYFSVAIFDKYDLPNAGNSLFKLVNELPSTISTQVFSSLCLL